ncbi:MAG TPA: tetratricopeptide repeat protein [Sandaracinaceae bacterium LLY-WYZ-13_1]|nr:tetratricopeptide repeat protein [Sandaracinaceae bacterium LLY-WYZ-13_1]
MVEDGGKGGARRTRPTTPRPPPSGDRTARPKPPAPPPAALRPKRPAAPPRVQVTGSVVVESAPSEETSTDVTHGLGTLPDVDASVRRLRDLCEAQLATEEDPERKAHLHRTLGRLHEVQLADPKAALVHYDAALRERPDDAATLRAARRAATAVGAHARLPALFDAEVRVAREPAARARLLFDEARVLETELGRPQDALAVYREALALDPGHLEILHAIRRAHRRDERWAELAATLEALANATDDPALRAAYTASRARITETRLNDPAVATELYAAALAADPHATDALAHLKRLGASHGRWGEVVEALRRELTLTRDPAARLGVLRAIARVAERHLKDAAAASAALEEALEIRPEDGSLLDELARLSSAHGRHDAAARALARRVDLEPDAGRRATLCLRLGQLHEGPLDDPRAAETWYERALVAEPTHRGAALALVRLLEARQEWIGLLGVWSRRAAAVTDPAEQAPLHHRIGEILEVRLQRPDEAAEQHRRVLALDPDHHQSFLALCRLSSEAGRWHEVAQLYDRAAGRAAHDPEAIVWLFRLGGVYEDHLADPAGAIGVYDRILARDPAHLGAHHALQRAAERAGETGRLVDALRAEAELTGDEAREHALLHRAAVLTAERLGDAPAAERSLEAILAARPEHRPSLESLAKLKAAAGKWADVVSLYARLVPLDEDPARLHRRVGEIRGTHLGDDAGAIAAYREALRLDPDDAPARDALCAALERTQAWDALATALGEALERTRDPAERAARATELGGLLEERLGDEARALERYEQALEAEPLHRAALDARERLLTRAGDDARLAAALEREAAGPGDAFARTQAALRAAILRGARDGTPALDAFRPVFAAHADHLGALLAVEAIYDRAARDNGLAATWERLAGAVSDRRAELAALHEMARARRRSGGDAVGVYRQILAIAPDDVTALEALAEAARRADDADTELEMQSRLATLASDPGVAAHHQLRVGELLMDRGDPESALAAFGAAVGYAPRDPMAVRSATSAARAARDPAAMERAARREHEVTRDRDFAVQVLLEAAELHREAGDEDAAAGAYERALALDPDHPEAATGLMATAMRPATVPRLVERLGHAAHAATDPDRRAVLHLSVALLHADALGDLAAAIAATKRALDAHPRRWSAHDQLATYLERNAQWREAVEVLEASLERRRGAALLEARLRLARHHEHHLRDADAAQRHLRAVLAVDDGHPEALTSLARLERLAGRDEEALRLVRRLFEVVADDDRRRAAALAEMAELEKRRGQLAEAASAAWAAVEIQGPTGTAAHVYRGLIAEAPAHASWERYGDALMKHLTRAKVERLDLPATYRELARVFGDARYRPEALVEVLADGVRVCPFDASISLAFVEALRERGQHERALGELRRWLSHDVLEVGAWRALAEVMHQRGDPDGSAVALAPLVVLGQASAEEARVVEARPVRAAEAPPGILAHAGFEQLADPGVLGESAAAFIASLGEVITKLEGIEHERWGVSKRDRIRPGEPHPLRALADRIARILGAPEFDLFVVRQATLSRSFILAGSPPALLVPAAMERERDPVLTFHLARPLALLSRGLHPLDHVDDAALERLLVGAVRQFEPGFRLDPLMDEEALETQSRRVGKAVGFFSRGRVQEASHAFAADPTHHLPEWAREVRRLAARAALLVADDLVAVLGALGEELGPDNYASDLARFWVSDPALRFRRAVAQARLQSDAR